LTGNEVISGKEAYQNFGSLRFQCGLVVMPGMLSFWLLENLRLKKFSLREKALPRYQDPFRVSMTIPHPSNLTKASFTSTNTYCGFKHEE
jgi:hypothetical protein